MLRAVVPHTGTHHLQLNITNTIVTGTMVTDTFVMRIMTTKIITAESLAEAPVMREKRATLVVIRKENSWTLAFVILLALAPTTKNITLARYGAHWHKV